MATTGEIIRKNLRDSFQYTYGRAIVDDKVYITHLPKEQNFSIQPYTLYVEDKSLIENSPYKDNYDIYWGGFWLESIITGFIGWPIKYRKVLVGYVQDNYGNNTSTPQYAIHRSVDWRTYNIFEQILLPARLVKNIVKLGTEFIPFALANLLINRVNFFAAASKYTFLVLSNKIRKENQSKLITAIGFIIVGIATLIFTLLWLAARTTALVGQSITSPFSAIKLTLDFFKKRKWTKTALFAAAVHSALIVAAYAAFAAFLLPIVAPALTATLAVTLINASAAFGLSIPLNIAATAAVAGLVALVTPLLAGIKIGARWMSWNQDKRFVPTLVPGEERVKFNTSQIFEMPPMNSSMCLQEVTAQPTTPPSSAFLSSSLGSSNAKENKSITSSSQQTEQLAMERHTAFNS